ncbi:hypothetical protein T440DRAFT_407073 [Plenodomus tracheiphilus IPT5]|uniref:Adhesin domain-containing protein n=1 Tax=Plenodomus tracheiphilus IPT5 TaxID=1408161 RepID=A0A6A7ARZ3_9PLEO|nr:hypothetical protein T440DRAFT_407073 [Plenodomus tracheiphilus IPT5]
MFIDTATANTRSSRPQIIITPSRETSPYNNDSQTPLLETFVGQDAPPPTYLEATTPGLYTARLSGEEGARLLSFDGRQARDATFKEEQYSRRSLRQQCLKKKWLKLVAGLILFILLVAMLAALLAAVSTRKDTQTAATSLSSSAQSATEDASHPDGFIDDDSDRPDLIAIPWPAPATTSTQPTPPAESKQIFPIRWPSKCGKEYNVKTEEHDLGITKELEIREAVHQLDGHYRRVSGWIHVAPASIGQAPGTIQMRVSYAVSSSVNIESVSHTTTPTGLTIGDPSFPDGFDGVRSGSACLGMSVTLYVAPGASLETFTVGSTHMGMQVHTGVDLTVTKATSISLTTGTLDAVAFNSTELHLKTISGSISGKYLLHDRIFVETKSGSVNIDIEPQPTTDRNPKPAIFMVDTLSGSVRTDFIRKHIPERDYQTYINSTVGSVDGTFIHGSRTEINSIAGLVTADLLPFRSGDYQSEIYTQTHSGQTTLLVRSPYKAKKAPLSGLVSTHKSTSGGLDVTYPEEWTGVVDGTSLSGALHLQGKELQLVSENDEPGKNHVEATKGTGGSSMSFDTVSGGCEVKIGKL